MIYKYFITACLCLLLSTCSYRQGINREIKPAEKYDINIDEKARAFYEDAHIEACIEIIGNAQWEKIASSECFKSAKGYTPVWRMPKMLFIRTVIKNKREAPVEFGEIRLQYKPVENEPLSAKEIKEKYKSPAYYSIDFKSLLKTRRITGENIYMDDLDPDKDTILYNFDFICESDKISKITAFEWIPVEYRAFRIIVEIKSGESVKLIDFTFNRFEFREEGPFRKPVDQKIETEIW